MIFELVAASIQISRFLDLAYFAVILALVLVGSNFGWRILRQIAFDGVAIYAALSTAKCDEERRQLDLEVYEHKLIMLVSGRGER